MTELDASVNTESIMFGNASTVPLRSAINSLLMCSCKKEYFKTKYIFWRRINQVFNIRDCGVRVCWRGVGFYKEG